MNYIALPPDLEKKLLDITAEEKLSLLKKSYESLSERYRSGNPLYRFDSRTERIAYLIGRLPATYAAVLRIFSEIASIKNDVKTLLDIGAGSGSASLAAETFFPQLAKITCIEKDLPLINIGKELEKERWKKEWIAQDLEKSASFPSSDLVLFSYSFGELSESRQISILEKAWEATNNLLIIVEPGSKRGFSTILSARKKLIEWGGSLLAPCPHCLACPMKEPDWCHFSVRLQRSKAHAYIKEGSQGYEDEKFSYLILSKKASTPLVNNRIVKPPMQRSGHITFSLCKEEGITATTFSKKEGERYKEVKKLFWGDSV